MDVRTSPTTKPEIDRLISPPMAEYLRARSGAIAARMATRIFGASNNRRSTNANTAASDATTEIAPLPRLRAGLLRLCAYDTSFGEFLFTQDSMWYLRTRWPIQPFPCSALLTYPGRSLAKCVMLLTSG